MNAASFQGGAISPGEIITIFATDAGPPGQSFGFIDPIDGRLGSQLEGVSVAFSGTPAPLFFVNETQINAQVPYSADPGGISLVTITRDGQSSEAVAFHIRGETPAIFMGAGTQAAALNSDSSVNDASRPAFPGETVAVFGTGQGRISPSLETGQLAGGPFDLSFIDATVSATVGGRPAPVSFAGMAPGLVGLFQANLVIPGGTPAGAIELNISIGGSGTQPGVTLSVK